MCFLDATYKTMKYSLPLFFVAVKTNVNYTVVAEFVIQDETTASITEALSVLKVRKLSMHFKEHTPTVVLLTWQR